MFLCHMDKKGKHAHPKVPFPFDIIGARAEFLFMKVLGKMTDAEWLYRFSVTKKAIDFLANSFILKLMHGEVITPDDAEKIANNLEKDGFICALGLCECRHGENRYEKELIEGHDPNYTCVMIGNWGRGHLYNYPSDYRTISAKELNTITRFWHENGRVLTAWGCSSAHGFILSYCHCLPYYCVPLRNAVKRGTRVFLKGYRKAYIDANKCQGVANCKWKCVERCSFGAIRNDNGKAVIDDDKCHGCGQCFLYCPEGAAMSLFRDSHELRHCPKDLMGIEEQQH